MTRKTSKPISEKLSTFVQSKQLSSKKASPITTKVIQKDVTPKPKKSSSGTKSKTTPIPPVETPKKASPKAKKKKTTSDNLIYKEFSLDKALTLHPDTKYNGEFLVLLDKFNIKLYTPHLKILSKTRELILKFHESLTKPNFDLFIQLFNDLELTLNAITLKVKNISLNDLLDIFIASLNDMANYLQLTVMLASGKYLPTFFHNTNSEEFLKEFRKYLTECFFYLCFLQLNDD